MAAPGTEAPSGEKTLDDLKAGDEVEAIGLTESGVKDLNGQVGILIKRYAKKNGGRLEVRFTENGKPKIVALDPENSCVPGGSASQNEKARKDKEKKDQEDRIKTTRGKYVEVFGLESEKGMLLNAQRGIVIRKIEATGRIEVCLGIEGKLTSLKVDCLKLVVGADATEIENAKERAFPHLKADMESRNAAQQSTTTTSSTAPANYSQTAEQEREWSPPPDVRQAAGAAALQAASVASARGFNPQQAEAYGAAAAERTLLYAKQVAQAQAAVGRAQAAQAAKGVPGMVPGMAHPGMAHPGMAAQMPIPGPPSAPREEPKTIEEAKIGDSLEAYGLRGENDTLNGDKGIITNILGWSNKSKRYVMIFKTFIITDDGDLGEKEKNVILNAENVRIPGSGPDEEDDVGDDDDLGESSDSRSRSRRRKRSRSRKRSRRR